MISLNTLKLSFDVPFNYAYTRIQTYRCRKNNADICINNRIYTESIFALVDYIYKRTLKDWKKKYKGLKEVQQ